MRPFEKHRRTLKDTLQALVPTCHAPCSNVRNVTFECGPTYALQLMADRVVQTTISRLASGHIRGLSFHLGQNIYENCTKCNLVQATPDHLLFCAGLDREDIYSSPLLVTATAGSDVVQSGRPIFDDFFQHLWPYIGNNTVNVVFQMVKGLWLIRIDQ
ncbi:hypothetical protein TNCV_2685681 [Trichonephila clavipes]|nr:hypothetical protein TNCV_2685681 [Trichonephila clavipes]